MHAIGIAALLALMSAPTASVVSADACTKIIPNQLIAQLRGDYPTFRPVRVSDYSQENLAYPKAHGISCPGVALADVHGNGMRDIALFITSENGHTLLIAADKRGTSKWRVVTLSDFGNEGVSDSYVEPLAAGTYTDLFAEDIAPSDYVTEPGRVKHYRSRHAGFLAGEMESSGTAFFFTGKRWVHLALSD